MTQAGTSQIEVAVASEDFSDWQGLLALLHAAYAYMDGRIDPPSSLLHMDAAELERKSRAETLVLALDAGRLVGCLFAAPRPKAIYVGKLAVHPDFRMRGLARRLMNEAQALARARGVAFVELETRIELQENHATFAALGFVKTAETSHAGYDRVTSITMRRPVAGP